MKNIESASIGNNWAKTCKAGLVLMITAVLTACGGSGGGSDDAVTPVDPADPAGETYVVSGTVNDLIGTVQISDGFQTLSVTEDGAFAFTHEYTRGDTFAITVDTGTTDQLCTVTKGAGLILADVDDVSIDCLEIRETNIRVSKPQHYSAFGELNLRSSYQHIPQLAGEVSRLVVAKNQFVTVVTSGEQSTPVYVAFVKSFDETLVNSLSTAVSLVLLNPSIHGAIEEREARFEFFASRITALPAVTILADAIKSKADAGEFNVLAPTSDVLRLLDSAVLAAAADIVSSDTSATAAAVSAANRTQGRAVQKLQVTPINGTPDGVSLVLQKITPDASGNNYQLQISNAKQRYIAVESPLLTTPIALVPGGSQSQLLQSSSIDSVLWTVFGPGAQAASAPVSASVTQSVIDTASEFYALPSLTFATGRLDAFNIRLLACMDAETLQQIREEANAALLADETLAGALQKPNYTAAYDAVAAPLRASVIANLGTLMQCEYFRKGHWLDQHEDTAVPHIRLILDIAQAYYAPRIAGANALVVPNLLAAGTVINSSMTEQQWQLSNKLAISLTQTRNGVTSPISGTVTVNAGETLLLGASCMDPVSSTAVTCDVQWTSPQGTIAGNTLSQILSASGSVSVAATDEEGATASTSIAVTVVPLPPRSTSYWTLQDGANSQRFDINDVRVEPDTNDSLTQIRGFPSATVSYPQISISLPQLAGAGSYVLNDLAFGRGCLGFIAVAQSVDQSWCTKTTEPFDSSPATGTVNYTTDPQGKNSVDFDFTVVPTQCAVLPCTQQRVSGHIELP